METGYGIRRNSNYSGMSLRGAFFPEAVTQMLRGLLHPGKTTGVRNDISRPDSLNAVRSFLFGKLSLMQRAFRIIKLIFLGISILLCLAIPVAGLVSTATSWDGICYGFTDGQHDCPWWEYAWNEMFWASFLFIPLLFGASLVWLVMASLQFIAPKVQKRKRETDTTRMSS